jgi:Ni,Fe-hydrogenase maturation factor
VGRYLANDIAEQAWPHCRVLSVHQLTPELAAAIATVEQVIFIDAQLGAGENNPGVQIKALEPTTTSGELGHRGSPTELLTLARILYGTKVKAWWILIPAINFDYGEDLSVLTQTARLEALEKIKQLLQGPE